MQMKKENIFLVLKKIVPGDFIIPILKIKSEVDGKKREKKGREA